MSQKKKRLSFLPNDEGNTQYQSKSTMVEEDDKSSIRYRIEQKNATKIGDVATFNSDIRKEYLVELNKNNRRAYCKLTDYVYQLEPKDFEKALQEMQSLEYSREDVTFLLSANSKIIGIENLTLLKKRWDKFKEDFVNSNFFKEIKDTNSRAASDIIDRGDLEFSNEEVLIETYYKNLFFHILFKNYSNTDLDEKLSFMSQIFHNTTINLQVLNTIVKEDENHILYRSVGVMDSNSINKEELIRQYEELYKPTIKYNYSEYNFDYRITRNVNKHTNEIESARAVIIERVKNNYELISEFDLKRVEL